ncbi:hypothetical protein [Nocardia concava]|uniref:hypothetical protein n=1 Tax=Nocardia concava TaxID=257281 RepID=UPI000305AC81|nr:hypothetical protein [Nocardia concava]
MAAITLTPRAVSLPATLSAIAHRLHIRARLTDQERHNMAAARSRVAVYTASLGGHPFHS